MKRSYAADRQFALCESCFWSATILRSGERNVHITACSVCSSDNISVIPITSDDVYELDVGSKGGLEIEFPRASKI